MAPATKDDDTSRRVYLPPGVWYDFWTDHRYAGPTKIEAAAPMERIPLFVRGGAIVPSQQDMQYTDQAPIDPLTFDVYPDGTSSRQYYEDDGISFDYQHGVSLRQRLTAAQETHGVRLQWLDWIITAAKFTTFSADSAFASDGFDHVSS